MSRDLPLRRITAFWALSESGLGGILHATQVPFKGALLTAITILCITLIARLSQDPRRDILRATLVVILIKAAISPHSPITAYLAVGFQGVLGALLMTGDPLSWFRLSLLTFVALIESAIQKLLTLWLFFGTAFWQAVDAFGDWIAKLISLDVGGYVIPISLYLGVYAVVGLIALRVIPVIHKAVFSIGKEDLSDLVDNGNLPMKKRNRRRSRNALVLIIGLIVLLVSYSMDGWGGILFVVLRTLVVIYLWFNWVSPWLSRQFLRWMSNRSTSEISKEVEESIDIFPHLRAISRTYWNRFVKGKERSDWKSFFAYTLAHLIKEDK